MISLDGRVALVTGGSRGIGAACVRLLSKAGAKVGFSYLSRDDEAERLVDEITFLGRPVFSFKADVATADGNQAFVQAAIRHFGGVDIFVANAGVWPAEPMPVEVIPGDRWQRVISTNLKGIFHGVQAVLPVMREGGRLICISSTAGQRGEAGHADYAASKGAVISLVKSLAVELGSRDITVNAVAPGWVDTEAVRRPFAGEGRKAIEHSIPLGRVASPDDIAGPVVFLASPLARHITGEILNVNGGSVLCG